MVWLFLFSLLVPALIIFAWERVVIAFSRKAGIFYKSTGLIGTPVHELAHAIGCLLFGLRITGMRLFSLSTHEGPMGYVSFSYNPHRLRHQIGCLIQGIAPLLASGFLITYFLGISVPQEAPLVSLTTMFGWFYSAATGSIWQLWTLSAQGWQGLLSSFLLSCVALHGIPSVADIKISLTPLTCFAFGGALILALAHALFGWDLSAIGQWPAVSWVITQVEIFLWWLLAASGAVVALAMLSGLVFLIIPGLIAQFMRRTNLLRPGAGS